MSDAGVEQGMAKTSIPERLQIITQHEAFVVRCWWRRLTLTPTELKAFTTLAPRPRGVRAALRRCDSVEAALLTEAFRQLWDQPSKPVQQSDTQRDLQLQQWACIALVLAELRAETPNVKLGDQLGQQKKETGGPYMSELRFRRLMDCQSPIELVRQLRRALALIDKRGVSAVYLADNIALWWREYQGYLAPSPTKRLGFQWANDYFNALSKYQRDDD